MDHEKEQEQLKFRDLYMEKVYQNIDQYRIDALKKISMERYDEVKVGCDPEVQDKNKKREKLFHIHSKLLKFHWLFTKGNVLMALAGIAVFAVFILPSLFYTFSVFDRHMFGGWFHEREPIYAKTTAN